jgi:hypothetical protein
MPRDGGNLILSFSEYQASAETFKKGKFTKRYIGAEELIQGKIRYCIWIEDELVDEAKQSPQIQERLDAVYENRMQSNASSTRDYASKPHRFVQIGGSCTKSQIAVPSVSSENRPFLPVDYLNSKYIPSNLLFALYDAPLWNMALIASRIHLVWIATVCGKMKTDFRYSNTLGWNTFPVPTLTEKNKEDLTCCAEDILLAREAHFPATIADLYDPENMPQNLREAHERNDEVLERIYIGRRFKNDTERLEKLFELYVKMTKAPQKLEFNS